jgi:hypothetical protein
MGISSKAHLEPDSRSARFVRRTVPFSNRHAPIVLTFLILIFQIRRMRVSHAADSSLCLQSEMVATHWRYRIFITPEWKHVIMKSWNLLNISGATCLIAVGQLQAGHIDFSTSNTSSFPMPVDPITLSSLEFDDSSSLSLDSDFLSSTDLHLPSDSYSSAFSTRVDCETECTSEFGQMQLHHNAAINDGASELDRRAAPQVTSASKDRTALSTTVLTQVPERTLVTRPLSTKTASLFPMMFTFMASAAFGIALKKILEMFNSRGRLEHIA